MLNGDKVSVITAAKNRDTIFEVLPIWLSDDHVDEIVVVDWGSDVPFSNQLKAVGLSPELQKLVEQKLRISRTEHVDWILSWAFNMAASLATGDILLKLDADYGFREGFFDSVGPELGRSFHAGKWGIARNPNEVSLNGMLMVYKEDFSLSGGYNEFITTYGYEDDDLYHRLCCRLVRKNFDLDLIYHIPHEGRLVNQNVTATEKQLITANVETAKRFRWDSSKKRMDIFSVIVGQADFETISMINRYHKNASVHVTTADKLLDALRQYRGSNSEMLHLVDINTPSNADQYSDNLKEIEYKIGNGHEILKYGGHVFINRDALLRADFSGVPNFDTASDAIDWVVDRCSFADDSRANDEQVEISILASVNPDDEVVQSESNGWTNAGSAVYAIPSAVRKDNLVIASIGDGSIHHKWLNLPYNQRNFDLFLVYFGDRPDAYSGDAQFRMNKKGYKWPNTKHVMESFDLSGYKSIWMPDEDIEISGADINRMFDIFNLCGLSLAQPSLVNENWSHPCTINNGIGVRYTNFVEVMAPIFRSDVAYDLMDTFIKTKSSWGVDWIWSHLLGGKNMAIIDDVTMRHTRPVFGGVLYDTLKSIGLDPFEELEAVKSEYDIRDHTKDFFRVCVHV